ncbi:MAG: hypothetical protein WC850_01880 [Candidatus Gracilibacteria bacterium]
MKKDFKLEFIKYYPEIKEKYGLSSLDTLVYGYIKAVIEFESNVSCFATSNTIANTIKFKPGSIDNSINKLKKAKLIETTNKFIGEQKRNKRVIYLFGQGPKKKFNEVDEFFYYYGGLLEENKATRGIIGHLLFKLGKSPKEIEKFIYEKMESDDYSGEMFSVEDLREIYIPSNEVVEYSGTSNGNKRLFRHSKINIENESISIESLPF